MDRERIGMAIKAITESDITAAVLLERERCARIASEFAHSIGPDIGSGPDYWRFGSRIAEKIREGNDGR